MLHNKLIEILDGQIAGSKAIGCKCIACDNAIALRAVVELHKPKQIADGINSIPAVMYVQKCACGNAGVYPCPTIQAIEKELN